MVGNESKSYAQYGGRSSEERALEHYAALLTEKIRAIDKDCNVPWLPGISLKWPKSLSGKDFNGMNALMLLLHSEKEGYKVPVFMTFEQVTKLNGNGGMMEVDKAIAEKNNHSSSKALVLKGAKSFPVCSTKYVVECNGAKIDYADYQKLPEEKKRNYVVYPRKEVYNVFNIDQTNLRDSRPELYNKIVDDNRGLPLELTADIYSFPAIDEIIKNNEWLCSIHLRDQVGGYSPTHREISIPERDQFSNGELFYGRVLYEMIHSTGSESYLNRFGVGYESLTYPEKAGEDLIAELGSAVIMQRYGLSKYIEDGSRMHVKEWLDKLEKSPAYLNDLLGEVKSSVGMVNEKIEAVNRGLLAGKKSVEKPKVLYVTGECEDMVSEFHLLDKESCDVVYKLLKNNIYEKDTGRTVEVSRPTDKTVRIDMDCGDAVDYVYDCLDSETLSKIVDSGYFFHGQKVEEYSYFFHNQFITEFEKKRNDPDWLKEQGLEGNVSWDLNFISTNGYHLARAVTDTQCKLGALDCNGDIFLPFEDVGSDINIERDLGYMTELRRRLLYDDGKVDGFGRIAMCGQLKHDADTGVISRDFLIDGEAKGEFVLRPDDNIFCLNFMLEHPVRIARPNENVPVCKESVQGIDNLLRIKDMFYPIRFINDKVNMPLIDYCKSEELSEHEKLEKANKRNTMEIYPGVYAFKSNEGMWGLQDKEERTVLHPRWLDFQQKGNGDVVFSLFRARFGIDVPGSVRVFTQNDLKNMAKLLPRMSEVGVVQRGRSEDHWITANIDNKPMVSKKIQERDWIEYQGAAVSALELGMKYFSEELRQNKEEQVRLGVKM